MARIPVDTDIPILLAQVFHDDIWASHGGRALVIVPDESSWNDFGNNFRAVVHFVGFPGSSSVLPMRLMFPNAPRTSARVRDILGGTAQIRIDNIREPFVSVFEETIGYRTLVERLGFDDAFASLRKMHDVVAAQLEGVDNETLDLAKGTDFTQGVVREDSTWTAFRQGARYLTPHGAPDVDDAAKSFRATVELDGLNGPHVLEADFDDDFPLSRRALVLVGENGVGKTRLLQSIIAGLQRPPTWASAVAPSPEIFLPRPTFSRLLMFSSAASDPYPADIPPWQGLDYRFHRMIGVPLGATDDLAQSLLDVTRYDGAVAGRNGATGIELLDIVLETLDIKEQLHVQVSEADEPDTLPSPTRVGGRLYLPFFVVRNEERRLQLQSRMIPNASPQVILGPERARALSSGEQALLRFAAQAIGSLRPGSMFLFDEPETHLHPHYVSLFMSMLDQLLEHSASVAIIATHSAYVVREVPARRVRIVTREVEGETVIIPPRLQTFGASIDTISQFVFGDIAPKHRFQTALDRWLADTPDASVEKFKNEFRDDLSAEVLAYIAQALADRQRS